MSKKLAIYICVLIGMIVIVQWGTPWGRLLCDIKFKKYIGEQFDDLSISSAATKYDKNYQQYRMFCHDNTHDFSFCVHGTPYTPEVVTDYVFRYWENEIFNKYTEKYPMYEFLPIISVDYPWLHRWPVPEKLDMCEYEAYSDVPLYVAVYTEEYIRIEHSETMHEMLVNLFVDFETLPLFEVEIFGRDGSAVFHAADVLVRE